jgi:hypothetical protein
VASYQGAPFIPEIGGKPKLSVAALEVGEHLGDVAAIELEFEAFEQLPELEGETGLAAEGALPNIARHAYACGAASRPPPR